jgi:ribosomal protein S18 acetylase RimI-like enzyme
MIIQPLTPEHATDAAALHQATVPGLLTRLGPAATTAFYAGCARSAWTVGFAALDETRVVGFVLGSEKPDALRSDVLRRNPVGVAFATIIGGLRRPSALVGLGQSVFSRPSYDAGSAELIYLAVAAEQRGRGIGEALVRRFGDALRERGVSRFELSVDANNADAVRFYERLGFTRIGSYREFGHSRLRYASAPAADPGR